MRLERRQRLRQEGPLELVDDRLAPRRVGDRRLAFTLRPLPLADVAHHEHDRLLVLAGNGDRHGLQRTVARGERERVADERFTGLEHPDQLAEQARATRRRIQIRQRPSDEGVVPRRHAGRALVEEAELEVDDRALGVADRAIHGDGVEHRLERLDVLGLGLLLAAPHPRDGGGEHGGQGLDQLAVLRVEALRTAPADGQRAAIGLVERQRQRGPGRLVHEPHHAGEVRPPGFELVDGPQVHGLAGLHRVPGRRTLLDQLDPVRVDPALVAHRQPPRLTRPGRLDDRDRRGAQHGPELPGQDVAQVRPGPGRRQADRHAQQTAKALLARARAVRFERSRSAMTATITAAVNAVSRIPATSSRVRSPNE